MDIVAKTQFVGGHNLHKILGFEPRDPVMNMFSKAEKNIRESAPVNRALALPGSGTITNTNRMPPFKCVENHPAGWVIECGGVAILMFVDPVPFGVLQWISCLFVKFASQFRWFYCFSARWPSNMDISSPEKYSIFGGSFHKVTVGP